MTEPDKKIVCPDMARSDEVKEELLRIQEKGFCPFCSRDYLENEHPKQILKETDNWLVTENRWVYKNSKTHLLFIHKRHLTNLSELPNDELLELFDLIREIEEENNIPGATLVWRHGECMATGGTLYHLHAQLVSGDISVPDREPAITRIA